MRNFKKCGKENEGITVGREKANKEKKMGGERKDEREEGS